MYIPGLSIVRKLSQNSFSSFINLEQIANISSSEVAKSICNITAKLLTFFSEMSVYKLYDYRYNRMIRSSVRLKSVSGGAHRYNISPHTGSIQNEILDHKVAFDI
jgi:hypothetical protein